MAVDVAAGLDVIAHRIEDGKSLDAEDAEMIKEAANSIRRLRAAEAILRRELRKTED